MRAFFNNKQMVIGQILSPVLYLLFYAVGISSTFGEIEYRSVSVSFLQYAFTGIIGIVIYTQMTQAVYRIILDRKWGLLTFKYFKGVSPLSYFLGKMSFPFISFSLQILVLYILSFIVGDPFSLYYFLILILISTVSMLFWFSLGTIIALRVTSYKLRDLIMNTLLIPIIFSAPTFYSFENAPTVIKTLSYFNPLTYQLGALRDFAFTSDEYGNLLITLLLSICLFLVAVLSINKAELLSDER